MAMRSFLLFLVMMAVSSCAAPALEAPAVEAATPVEADAVEADDSAIEKRAALARNRGAFFEQGHVIGYCLQVAAEIETLETGRSQFSIYALGDTQETIVAATPYEAWRKELFRVAKDDAPQIRRYSAEGARTLFDRKDCADSASCHAAEELNMLLQQCTALKEDGYSIEYPSIVAEVFPLPADHQVR